VAIPAQGAVPFWMFRPTNGPVEHGVQHLALIPDEISPDNIGLWVAPQGSGPNPRIARKVDAGTWTGSGLPVSARGSGLAIRRAEAACRYCPLHWGNQMCCMLDEPWAALDLKLRETHESRVESTFKRPLIPPLSISPHLKPVRGPW